MPYLCQSIHVDTTNMSNQSNNVVNNNVNSIVTTTESTFPLITTTNTSGYIGSNYNCILCGATYHITYSSSALASNGTGPYWLPPNQPLEAAPLSPHFCPECQMSLQKVVKRQQEIEKL